MRRRWQRLSAPAARPPRETRAAEGSAPTSARTPAATSNHLSQRVASDLASRAGNRAAIRAISRTGETVQRDIGFEYETNADTYQTPAVLTEAQSANSKEYPPGMETLEKGTVIVDNIGALQATADERVGGGSDLEFVIKHQKETNAGRNVIRQALVSIEQFVGILESNRAHISGPRLAKAFGGAAQNPLHYVHAGGSIHGNPQTTAGIRLDKIAQLMEEGVGIPTRVQNAAGSERHHLGGQNKGNAQIVGDAPILGDAPQQVEDGYRQAYPNVKPSQELLGLCALLLSYMVRGTAGQWYAKQIAPLMARTDFASIFGNDLDPQERQFFAENNGAEFVALFDEITTRVGLNLNDQLFQFEPLDVRNDNLGISQSLTRRRWIEGIAQGTDYLAPSTFPSPAARTDIQEAMQGLGGYGTKHDAGPAPGDVARPILEFRRMEGRISPNEFTQRALGVFDYVVALNAGLNKTYSPVPADASRPSMWQRLRYYLNL